MQRWETFGVACSFLQIVGLLLIVMANSLPSFTPVLIGVCGFAAVAKFFLIPVNTSSAMRRLYAAAALCGLGIIALACTMV